jgi:hypothetical protein
MHTVFLFTAALWFIFMAAPHAMAAPQYTATPLVIDESLLPRDIANREITLINTGSEPVTVYPTINNIVVTEGGGIQEFLPPSESDRTMSVSSWVEMSRAGIDLMAGETRTVSLIFRIPGTAIPGEYHAFIGFGYGRNRDEANMQVQNGRAPGTVLNITIEDTTRSFLKIVGFVVDRFVLRADNQAAVYTFQNPGDEPLTPTGEIIIYDSTGKEVYTMPVNAEGVTVPPGGEHVFATQVPLKGLFGKYKAFLSVEYGGAQRGSVQDIGFFYAVPLKMLLYIGSMLLVAVAALAWYTHRRYLDDDIDAGDSDRLRVHVRETKSEPVHHDLHIPKA